jgi:superfamily II DNA or RNA helicase
VEAALQLAEKFQVVGFLAGRMSAIKKIRKSYDSLSAIYRVSFWEKRIRHSRAVKKSLFPYKGKVYCVRVPHGLVVARRNSHIAITGNCHRMSAPCFQAVITLFPAMYRVGLSATPRRADGLQPVFEWHLGKVVAKMDGGNEIKPKIYQISIKTEIPESLYLWRDQKSGEVKKLFLSKLVNLLVDIPERNEWIVKEIIKATRSGRKIMLLSDRREHLAMLQRVLEVSDKSITVGLYMGGMKKEALKQSEQCSAILGTFAMAKEALDIVMIDTLFLATPKSDIEQPCGRILRYHEDKKEPIVVDLVDTLPACQDFARKRLKQYRRLGYNVVKSADS